MGGKRGVIVAVGVAAIAVAAAIWYARTRPLDILGSESVRYSQGKEELIIRDFFQDQRDGFFVDVGCALPEHNSTTYYLERHLGWSGIAIDALAEYRPKWRQMRPRSRFFAYLVTDHSGTEDPFYRAKWTEVSSIEPGRVLAGKEMEMKEIRVPSITLNDLLDQNGVEKIDFLSMDIEKSEPAALRGFDIDRFKPRLVCVEMDESTRDQINAYFAEHDYRRLEEYDEHDTVNAYFAPND